MPDPAEPDLRTHLYLIRHGESFANVEPVIGGMQGDAGLTPRGVQQAERLRDRLLTSGEIKADAFITSTLPRARQTAEIIASAISLPLIYDDEVQELRPGASDGLSFEQARTRFGFVSLEQEPLHPVSPGGEGWGQFMLRVGITLDRIIREYKGRTVVIVTHGGFIDGSFVYFFHLPSLTLPPIHFFTHNTSLTHWQQYIREGQTRQWSLSYYNDDSHLHGLAPEVAIQWQERFNAATSATSTNGHQPAEPVPNIAQADE